MTRTSPRSFPTRTNFHSSKLIRCLADLGMVEIAGPGNAFAEKLGSWIHFADAIALSGLQIDSAAAAPKRPPSLQADLLAGARAADAELERVHAFMKNSIRNSFMLQPGRSHMALPEPVSETPVNLRASYVPYRRFYEAHQRDMETSIQLLRTSLRQSAVKASPRLRKLAEVDAMAEKILRERENRLLSKMPALLLKRFEQLFREHQQKLEETQQADNPASWMKKNGWLTSFCNEMQMLLLAEMEFRLQPAMGLVEAFKQET
jgi:hypothetical protein